MEWTRSPLMRTIALAASGALILIHRDERGAWLWVGVALLVLNLIGFLATRSRAARGGEREDARSHRLVELLSVPGVAAAFSAEPELWRQVSHLDDTRFEPTTAAELAAFVWIEYDRGWTIGLGDEVKPYLDLDIDEADDPVISVLEAHPAVEEAVHEDREVYRVEQRQPIGTEEFAELAARALVSHHVQAAARL